MKLKEIIKLVFVITVFVSCQNKLTPLNQALEDIQNTWTEEELKNFAKKDIKEANAEIYFTKALAYRNKYFRSPKDSTLLNYFRELNVEHEDHMSGLVFVSLHRKLNDKDIDLDGQLEYLYDIQNEVKKDKLKNYRRASRYLKKYSIRDTIQLRRPIDNGKNAIRYVYPENRDWIYNDSLDFLLKGVILKRNISRDSSLMSYNIKVLSKNNDKVKVLMEEVNIGDTIEVNLRQDIIEDIRQ